MSVSHFYYYLKHWLGECYLLRNQRYVLRSASTTFKSYQILSLMLAYY